MLFIRERFFIRNLKILLKKEKLQLRMGKKNKKLMNVYLKRLNKDFFSRPSDIVAKEILGKILVRRFNKKEFRALIVETEAYHGNDDPASWASKGVNKVSKMMLEDPGKILIYNVHMYKMLNFVTGKKGEHSAVLIRALEPLNFHSRCSGPGLLTNALKIKDSLHGKNSLNSEELFVAYSPDISEKDFEIVEDFRIGVAKDLPEKMRFYIKGNKYVSRK